MLRSKNCWYKLIKFIFLLQIAIPGTVISGPTSITLATDQGKAWTEAVSTKVLHYVTYVPKTKGTQLTVSFNVTLRESGFLGDVKLRLGSADPMWDQAIERAIWASGSWPPMAKGSSESTVLVTFSYGTIVPDQVKNGLRDLTATKQAPDSTLTTYLGVRLVDLASRDPKAYPEQEAFKKKMGECLFVSGNGRSLLSRGCNVKNYSPTYQLKENEAIVISSGATRCCLSHVTVSSNLLSAGPPARLFEGLRGIQIKPATCDNLTFDSATYQVRFFEVSREKIPVFTVREEFSSGSAGGSTSTTVYFGMPRINCGEIARLDSLSSEVSKTQEKSEGSESLPSEAIDPQAANTAPLNKTPIQNGSSKTHQEDELGSKIFVMNPKSKPVLTSKLGRYWQCNGMVNNDLILVLGRNMTSISNKEKIPLPNLEHCLYKISKLPFFGSEKTLRTVEFFTSRESMENCLSNDYCDNWRSVSFEAYGENLYFTYSLTHVPNRQALHTAKEINVCQAFNGPIISWDRACGLIPELRQ